MNRFLYLLMALAAGALTVWAQTAADHKRPVVDGSVESVGGRLRVSLTNTDSAREFRGAAQVSIDAPDRPSEVANFEFTLAPQESRLFPIDSQGAAGTTTRLFAFSCGRLSCSEGGLISSPGDGRGRPAANRAFTVNPLAAVWAVDTGGAGA